MLVKDIGEFGLIGRIRELLPHYPPDVVVGIGDDVAVLKTSGPEYLLATCDAQVEGVHFTRGSISPYQLGRRAMAINISDIAAMGGNPLWALVSLALPESTEVAFIEELYRGMREEMSLAGAAIVGGNLSRTEGRIAIDVTLLGQVAPERLLLRNGAHAGDAVLVTGFPGESRAGFELMRRPGLKVSEPARKRVLERHLTPGPRLAEGRALGRSGLVSAMVDVSDGLLADLGHICRASGVGALIEAAKVPVGDAVLEVHAASVAGGRGEEAPVSDPLQWVLRGGEDYELLFTAAAEAVPRIQKSLLEETGIACRVIGKITGEAGVVRLVSRDGSEEAIASGGQGWDHFAGK